MISDDQKKDIIRWSLLLSFINISLYTFKIFNHPFNTEFYHVYFINVIISLILIFSIYSLYFKFFFFKNSFLIKFFNFCFIFYLFFTFLKSAVFLFGSMSFTEFLTSFGILFTNYPEGKIILLISILIIFTIFLIIFKSFKNLVTFLSYYGLIILIIQIYNVFTSDQLISHSKIKNFNTKNMSTDYPKKRAVILVFDEFDYSTFEKSDELRGGSIDKLKENSIFFQNAYAPGRDTINSMTSILIGHNGSGELRYNRSDFYFYKKDHFIKKIDFSNSFFEFSQNKKTALLHTSLINYCHYLKQITTCYDDTNNLNQRNFTKYFIGIENSISILKTISNNLLKNEKEKTDKKEINKVTKDLSYLNNIQSFDNFLGNSLNIIENNDHDIVLIHFPLPHYPAFYAKKKYNIVRETNFEQDYLINFRLLDEIVSNIMNMINNSPKDQENLLILTSDHGNRLYEEYLGEPRKVPLIFKLSTDENNVVIEKNSSNYHIKKIVKDFFKNDINHLRISNFYDTAKFSFPTMRNFEILDKLKKNEGRITFKFN